MGSGASKQSFYDAFTKAFDNKDINAIGDLYADDCVSDATWAAAADHFDDAQLVHLVAAAGCYRMVSGFLNSAGVQLDEGVPTWPERPGS